MDYKKLQNMEGESSSSVGDQIPASEISALSPYERWADRVCPRDQDGNRIGEPVKLANTTLLQKRDGGYSVGG